MFIKNELENKKDKTLKSNNKFKKSTPKKEKQLEEIIECDSNKASIYSEYFIVSGSGNKQNSNIKSSFKNSFKSDV